METVVTFFCNFRSDMKDWGSYGSEVKINFKDHDPNDHKYFLNHAPGGWAIKNISTTYSIPELITVEE